MPENNYHRLVVFILFICPKPLRRLLYNLASATVTPGQHFDFDRFLRSKKTILDNLVKKEDCPDDEDEQNDSFQRVSDRLFQTTETTKNKKNQKTLVDKNEVIHYKVSLSCWPTLKHSQELIETLIGYCHDLERTLKLSGTDEQHMEHIENVDVFVRGMSFDITDLSAEPEKHVRQDTQIYIISENMTRGMITKFAGILIETDRIRLVDSVSDTTLHVKDDVTLKNKCQNRMLDISSVIEVALFEPMFGKIKLLSRLISASSCDIEEECSDLVNQDISSTEILYDRLKPSDSSVGERQTMQTDGTINELNEDTMRNIRQHKHQIDRLLGEMIALVNRSTLSENVRPAVVHGYKTKELSKQIAEDLFQLHPTIKWCGYRYSTLHINVEHVSNASEHERRNKKIKTFLSGKNIEDYRLIYIQGPIKNFKYVGAQILSESRKTATLGCFSRYTKENQESVCGLLSKHFVLHSSKIYVENEVHFGTVLPATNEAGGYDIAAAEIVKRHVPQIDTRFKNYEDEVRPAYLYDKTDNTMLLNQPVYLRGAKTTLGVGTIHIPQVQRSGETGMAYIQMIDGSYALGKPSGKLAVEGDSGAIVCMDKIGTRNVNVLSMLMGEVICQPKKTAKMYSSLRLSCGLKYLEYKTKGKFTLKGIESGQEIVEQILLELLESLPIGTNETGQENSTEPIEKTDMEETDLSD